MTAMKDLDAMPTILILDDEFLVGLAIADDLERAGFRVAGPYADAEKAARALDDDRPDAAVLDINLGRGRTSYALAAMLAERGTPFVFLTGYGELAPGTQTFAEARWLSKPIAPEWLLHEVRRMLDGG